MSKNIWKETPKCALVPQLLYVSEQRYCIFISVQICGEIKKKSGFATIYIQIFANWFQTLPDLPIRGEIQKLKMSFSDKFFLHIYWLATSTGNRKSCQVNSKTLFDRCCYSYRPAYATHVLLACYVFLPLTENLHAFILGVTVTLCYLASLSLVTYRNMPDSTGRVSFSHFIYSCNYLSLKTIFSKR